MELRYDEWLPRSARLAGVVTAYWRVVGDGSNLPSSAVLPDGHVEVVFNLGDPVGLAGPAYRGLQPERAVVGPLSKALRLDYRGLVDTVGIRFHSARGAGFPGKNGEELAERLLPLFSSDWYDATQISVASGPRQDVRFVQNSCKKPKG